MESQFKPVTIIIKHRDGTIRERPGIKEPWRYIKKCMENPDVENAWIKKDE